MENGYPLGKDLGLLDTYYDRGIRYVTLVHSYTNDICDSSTDSAAYGGLSPFGEEVVARMNDLGIMVDLSHASDETFMDVISLSRAPVIASHSCAKALCDNPRNLSDELLLKLKENGGVIQMCILSAYVKTPLPYPQRDSARSAMREKYGSYYDLDEAGKTLKLKENGGVIQMCILSAYVKTPLPNPQRDSARSAMREKYGSYYDLDEAGKAAYLDDLFALDEEFPREMATVKDAVDHIDHIVELIGIDHIGIGTDFDGGGGLEDCFDVSQMGNITLELVRRGYSAKEIKKIWGGNLTRVLSEVEAAAI